MSARCQRSRPSLAHLFPLKEVPDRIPPRRGRKVHRSVGYRWAKAGLDGVRLRTVAIGGELHTSEEWLWEFIEAVTASRGGDL